MSYTNNNKKNTNTCDFIIVEKFAKLPPDKFRVPSINLDLSTLKFLPLDIYITDHYSFLPIDWNSLNEDMIDELFDKRVLSPNISSRFVAVEDIYKITDIVCSLIIPITEIKGTKRYEYDRMYMLFVEYPLTSSQKDSYAKRLYSYEHDKENRNCYKITDIAKLQTSESNIETISSFFY